MFKFKKQNAEDTLWTNIADLMSGLMIVFMFIAVVLLLKVEGLSERVDKKKLAIYKELSAEFKDDLPRWRAKIDEDSLSVVFEDPNIMFSKNSSKLKPRFKKVLGSFFPRFVAILNEENNSEFVDEIRVEGHTSSEGLRGHNEEQAFIYNMDLSQSRAFGVMKYSMKILRGSKRKGWVRNKLRANGYSSTRPILVNGRESLKRSRRVEFRVELEKDSVLRDLVRWSRARRVSQNAH